MKRFKPTHRQYRRVSMRPLRAGFASLFSKEALKRSTIMIAVVATVLSSSLSVLMTGTTVGAEPSPQNICATAGGTYSVDSNGDGVCTGTTTATSRLNYTEKIKSVLYYRAFVHCIALSAFDAAKATDPNQWPTVGGNYVDSTALDPNGDATLNCTNEGGWINDAISTWGFNDGLQMLCSFGWIRGKSVGVGNSSTTAYDGTQSYADCMNTSGSNRLYPPSGYDKIMSNMRYAIQAKGGSVGLTDAQIYSLYFLTLTSTAGCTAAPGTTPTPSGNRPSGKTFGNYSLPIVEGDGTAATVKFVDYTYLKNAGGNSDTAKVASFTTAANSIVTGSPAADGRNTCDYIAATVIKYGPAYLKAVQSGLTTSSGGIGSLTPPGVIVPSSTSCAIDGIGWIVCGIMRALASFNDVMYGAVEGILLTAPLQTTTANGTQTPQYIVWQTIRNIANILLVVVFLIIIFSQATSIGISSYGIKKMLPRLIIAAIAINISYFVMQLAVDAANLIGVGLNNFLNTVADGAFNATQVSFENVIDDIITSTAAITTSVAILSATSFTATSLGLLALPFLAVAALSILASFLTLFIRNSLIIVLVIVSPLAFAAYLLPNTADLFTKWRKLLTSMLLLFPTAALLFAGAKIAGYTIIGRESGPVETFFGYIVITLPLFMLPWLARQGGGILKTIGDRLQGAAKLAKKPLQDVLKPAVDRERAARDVGRAGFFGRRRQLDEDGYALNRDGTRRRQTLRQRIVNQRQDVEQTAKNDQDRKGKNWEQRAIDNPNGRTGAIITDKEQLHLRGNAQAEELKAHEAHRIADPASFDKLYSNRIADAKTETKPLQEEERRDQARRILRNEASTLGGGNLGDLSKAGLAATKRADAAEGKLNIRNRQNNAAADAAIQSIKLSEAQGKQKDSDEQKAYDNNKARLGTDEQIAEQGTVFNVNESARANAESKLITDQAADLDTGQQANRDAQFEAEQKSGVITDTQKNEQEARLGLGGDLTQLGDEKDAIATESQAVKDAAAARSAAMKVGEDDKTHVTLPGEDAVLRERVRAAARKSAIAKSVQTKAAGAETLVRAGEIKAKPDGDLAKAMAGTKDSGPEGIAGGISSNTGQVVGKANQELLADQQGDENVAREGFKNLNMGNVEALAVLGIDRNDPDARPDPIVKDGNGKEIRKNPDDTDKTAAIRQVTSGGDKGANDMLLDTILQVGIDAEEARNRAEQPGATEADKKDAEELTERAQRFQRAAIEEWSKNPGAMPPWVSSDDRDAMTRGRLATTKKELIIRGFAKGKYVPSNADRWDKDHFKSAADELGNMSEADIDTMLDSISTGPADKATKIASFAKMRENLDTLVDDPRYSVNLEDSALVSIKRLREKLDKLDQAGVIPAPKDYVRVEYSGPGIKKVDASGNTVPKGGSSTPTSPATSRSADYTAASADDLIIPRS